MTKYQVLLVEDEKKITDSLGAILRSHDFEVFIANSGVDALSIAKQVIPDVVVTDLMMPGMSGHEFLHEFRNTISSGIPFIVITAKSDYVDIRNAMQEGFDDYITKPFKTADLINSINKRLERKNEFNKPLTDRVSRYETAIQLLTNHEFNTPMTAIKGFADLITYHSYELKKDDLKQYIEYINGGADRLIELIGRLRFWQQLERNAIECIDSCIKLDSEFIAKVFVKLVNFKHRFSDVQYFVTSAQITGCNVLVENAIFELLVNAFKFSRVGEPIKIVVFEECQFVCLQITNENRIADIKQISEHLIFQQFNRIEQEQQGLGIGLAIVKMAMSKLKGSIEFEKNVNAIIVQLKFRKHDGV